MKPADTESLAKERSKNIMIKIPLRFSIVIPTYNSESHIKKCLSSIYSQKLNNFEVIVCDGKSNDKTLEIITKFELYKRINVDSRKDNGVYDAMNRGIDLASGEYIIFLGADDRLMDENVLSDIDKLLNNTIDVLYGDVDMDNQRYDGEFSLYKLMKTNICHQAMFYRRSLFLTYGKFNTNYKVLADYYFNIILFSCKDVSIKYTPRLISKFGTTGLSSHTHDEAFHKDRNHIVKKYFPTEYYEMYIDHLHLNGKIGNLTSEIRRLKGKNRLSKFFASLRKLRK